MATGNNTDQPITRSRQVTFNGFTIQQPTSDQPPPQSSPIIPSTTCWKLVFSPLLRSLWAKMLSICFSGPLDHGFDFPMTRSSVLERVARKKIKQEQRRKRIGHGKWVGRFVKRRQAKRLCNVGSWNTRQLRTRTGSIDQDLKLGELIDVWELRKWEIVTLVDTKLGTHATLETQSQTQPKWTIVSRGRVSIALNEPWTLAWRNSSIQVNTDGKGEACRSMLLQIPCHHKLGISIVATYAPSTNVTAEEQQTYLDDLEALLTHVKARHILILAGDFNAEIGIRDHHTQVLGPHGPRKRNLRGQHLIQFCTQQGLVVANTWTPQHHKTTWWHPRFNTPHLLDYFLFAKKHLGNVHRVLTIHPEVAWQALQRDWTPYTDHSPIEMQIKLAPPKGYQRQPTLTPRPATYKGRGPSQSAVALRKLYHDELQRHSLQHGIPNTSQTMVFWGDPAKFLPLISAYPSLNKLSALQRLPHSKTHTTNKNEKPTLEPARP